VTAGRHSIALSFAVLALMISAPARAGDAVKAGAALYEQMCTHCHGPNMVNPGTSSFDLRKFPRDQADRFYSSVKHGKGNMPAWGDMLKPFEIDQLWAYVSSRGGKLPPVKKKLKATASRHDK
jgi:mono/diheme cytochrome c family protein